MGVARVYFDGYSLPFVPISLLTGAGDVALGFLCGLRVLPSSRDWRWSDDDFVRGPKVGVLG